MNIRENKNKNKDNCPYLWIYQIHSPMLKMIHNAYLCLIKNAFRLQVRVV